MAQLGAGLLQVGVVFLGIVVGLSQKLVPRLVLMLRRLEATRYVTPLREGGSLPAIVEAGDCGLYVLKFRGAGQGPLALVAEVVAGEMGRLLGLRVPELVVLEVDAVLGRSEPDEEIQDLLKASAGLNLGMDYLPGSMMFDSAAKPVVEEELASRAVWFDALVMNVDRTARNANLLWWHRENYFIDHGAALLTPVGRVDDERSRKRKRGPMASEYRFLTLSFLA